MGWKVIIAPSGARDLEKIVAFIARDNPDAAERLGLRLISKVEVLASFPLMGRAIPEFKDPRLREIVHRSYRIMYRVNHEAEAVEIIRFWHAARGFPIIPPN